METISTASEQRLRMDLEQRILENTRLRLENERLKNQNQDLKEFQSKVRRLIIGLEK